MSCPTETYGYTQDGKFLGTVHGLKIMSVVLTVLKSIMPVKLSPLEWEGIVAIPFMKPDSI